MSFFIAEFERAAKVRKIAVYRFLISLLVPELLGYKEEQFQIKVAKKAVKIKQNQ